MIMLTLNIILTTSVEDINLNSIGEVFPNPTTDKFIFKVNESIDVNKIIILNTLSQLVPFTITSESERQFLIDISTLSSGLYFINYEFFSAKITKL